MQGQFNFRKVDYIFFISGAVLLTIGYLCMAFDPVENGFGILTLWFAPILLLTGFALPVLGIVGGEWFKTQIDFLFSKQFISENQYPIIGGALVFCFSLMAYLKTMEPTASLWDCSEFIAASYKLQVPHTPGNPLFLLIGRVFTMFSFGDVNDVAVTMNTMSALFSALAVLLLFHFLWIVGKRMVLKFQFPDWIVTLMAFSGAMSMAFIDSFWFSAVEAETYAAGSFFLLVNGWLGLMFWKIRGKETEKRWKVLTAYIVGLSYGIHPMCLLAIPVIGLFWIYKKREFTIKNLMLVTISGFVVLLIINRIVAVGLFEFAFYLDVWLVNATGLPFYSGAWLLGMMLSVSVFYLVLKKPEWNVVTWSSVFVILGFSTYFVLFIRSNHNPPIDETNPENMALIKAYMNRESYPSRPLLYGPYYDAEIAEINQGKKVYYKSDDEYKIAGHRSNYVYDKHRQTILPRIYSNDAAHVKLYRSWAGIKDNEQPTFIHNLKFLIQYQLGHMYWRYLMWNFGGRVSDIQHDGWLKPWESANAEIENNARNQYWMLPFLMGVIGFVFQYKHDKKAFATTLLFFLITGVILSLYLNSPPQEPRERDYIYVGSFMIFCIWIGYGVLAIYKLFIRVNNRMSMIISCLTAIAIPALLLIINWDDHDRSGRTVHMDSARNLLNTCEPNAILFTGGDNDTFPLWYLQEVEGFRTDVRVIVLSYFNTDWYIGQLQKKYYDSDAFNLTLGKDEYVQFGKNDVLYYREHPQIKGAIHAGKFLNLLKEDHPSLALKTTSGDVIHQIPSKGISIPIKEEALRNLNVPKVLKANIQDQIILKMKNNYLEKNALVFLDLIMSNHWERPIYFNYTSMNGIGLDVTPYLVQEGQLFQFLPVKNKEATSMMNIDKMYTNLIDTKDFDNLYDDRVYLNHEEYLSRIVVPLQQYFTTLAIACFNNGEREKAKGVMKKYLDLFQNDHIPSTYADLQAVRILSALGEESLAKSISEKAVSYFHKLNQMQGYDQSNDQFNRYLEGEFLSFLNQIG